MVPAQGFIISVARSGGWRIQPSKLT